MPSPRPIHFGFVPPSSDKRLTAEPFRAETFPTDVERAIAVALAGGFDSVWVTDHLMSGERYRLEAWTLLSWIASRHPGITVGTSVLVDAFRHPPLLAKMAATLGALTGCRLIVGYGAGWEEGEFRAFGYPVPSGHERLERMDGSLAVMRRLWDGGSVTYEGPALRVEGAIVEPRPADAPLLMVGGESLRSIDLAVRRADWWNMVHVPDDLARRAAQVDEACARVGRDPATLRRSVFLNVFLARSTDEARRSAGARLEGSPAPFAGTPEALADHLARMVDLGYDAFQLVFSDFPATSDIELFLERTLPAFRAAP
jgi:alkanesulfonate monooxygenase SsuD/methylene tetrahydromethanopterin reductase-like flavin-dependent oxidoreductase (luciferase family)